jgi:hypothetical protein
MWPAIAGKINGQMSVLPSGQPREEPMASRTRPLAMFSVVSALCMSALVTSPAAVDAGSISVTQPVNVTHDLFADNEESLGMNGSGTLLAGALERPRLQRRLRLRLLHHWRQDPGAAHVHAGVHQVHQ